jgi:hypothetical protein
LEWQLEWQLDAQGDGESPEIEQNCSGVIDLAFDWMVCAAGGAFD